MQQDKVVPSGTALLSCALAKGVRPRSEPPFGQLLQTEEPVDG